MKKKNNAKENWSQDSYETGSTEPPKSRGGLVAVLLVLVILLCGATSYFGLLNIRLGRQLQQFHDTDVPIQFLPSASDPSEASGVNNCVLPGVEGRAVSAPEQAYYNWPAGVVVTKVLHGSEAEQAGLGIGDIITSINGQAVTDPAAVSGILKTLQPGTVISVTFCGDDRNYQTFQCTL